MDKVKKVIFIAPQCPPKNAIVEDGYKGLQALVGGIISAAELSDNLAIYYHDEGLLEGLPPNVIANGTLFVGNLVAVRCDDNGDTIDTTDDDLVTVRDWLATCSRPGRFEYDIPPPQILTGEAFDRYISGDRSDLKASPGPTVRSVDGVPIAHG